MSETDQRNVTAAEPLWGSWRKNGDQSQSQSQRPLRAQLERNNRITLPRGSSPEWMERALCAASPEPWLWDGNDPRDIELAKEICSHCPVIAECAAEADRVDTAIGFAVGIWAGMTGPERREARRTRFLGRRAPNRAW